MKINTIVFSVLAISMILLSGCAQRRFMTYVSDQNGSVYRVGYKQIAVYRQFNYAEKCTPNSNGALECKQVKLTVD